MSGRPSGVESTSVLDVHCKAHDLDDLYDLYVVDTRFFPSMGAVNPS
jgi:choline dehydrogenase-like flavoprotein